MGLFLYSFTGNCRLPRHYVVNVDIAQSMNIALALVLFGI